MSIPIKISVITPSFNQGQFIEKNIVSVIEQNYANVEHLIIDGGSTDSTVDILKRYQSQLAYWVSEPDHGQSAAINKGFNRATGDILCWLNSDDYFEKGALRIIAEYFSEHSGIDMICGHVRVVDTLGREIYILKGNYAGRRQLLEFWSGYHMHQPSIFWRRSVYEKIGGVNERLHLTMDFDYWIRVAEHFNISNVDRVLSSATAHPAQKTSDEFVGYLRAQLRDAIRYCGIPRHTKDLPQTMKLYRHLLSTAVKIGKGQHTIYQSRRR